MAIGLNEKRFRTQIYFKYIIKITIKFVNSGSRD